MSLDSPADAFDELVTPLLRLDAAGVIVDANHAAGRWFGVGRRRLLGTPAAALERSAQEEADAAVAFADASPHPDPSTLFDYTYATPVPGESRRLPADPLF